MGEEGLCSLLTNRNMQRLFWRVCTIQTSLGTLRVYDRFIEYSAGERVVDIVMDHCVNDLAHLLGQH